jgi:NADH-quinone oxidoreductase subunit L
MAAERTSPIKHLAASAAFMVAVAVGVVVLKKNLVPQLFGQSHLFWICVLPLVGAAFNLLIGRRMPRWVVHTVACTVVLVSFVVAVDIIAGPLWDAFKAWRANKGMEFPGLSQNLYTWFQIGGFRVDVAFRLDTLSAVMVLVVTFVGFLIHVYSVGYMEKEPRYAAYFGYLNLFTGAMLILVLADNLPLMFVGWEGVGLCSFLLIGFWFTNDAYADAGRKAFVVNRIGDFAFLLGMFLLYIALRGDGTSLSFSEMATAEGHAAFIKDFGGTSERLAAFAGILLFIGACGKSAQIPLYVWLPDAMAGPTPVSALIHAATMVTAGVYMIARTSFLYSSSTTAMAVVAGVGAATALFAALMAFAQTDLKKVLAYSTVSQLGFMFVAVGVGAHSAGIYHLVTHAFFKAGLFLAAGSVMHAMSGSGDITKMGRLAKKLPVTHACFLIYCVAIAGIFPLSGFWSKDEILAGAFGAGHEGWPVFYGKLLWGVLSVAALCTAIYMFRLYFLVFRGPSCRADAETQAHIHESPIVMTMPLVVLATATVFLGILGLPHISQVPHSYQGWLDAWLHPSLVDRLLDTGITADALVERGFSVHAGHMASGTVLGLMGAALGIGALGIAIAWYLYRNGPSEVVERWATGSGKDTYKLALNKFYVDEIYEAAILKPFRWLAKVLYEFADKFVIDFLIVNGSAFVVDLFGKAARWVQNGMVQRYLAGILVGGAIIVWAVTRPSVEMTWKIHNEGVAPLIAELDEAVAGAGDDRDLQRRAALRLLGEKGINPYRVTLEGNAGSGPGAAGSKLRWYVDGQLKGEAGELVLDLGSGGTYDIRLEATDGVFDNTSVVEKKLIVPDVLDLMEHIHEQQEAEDEEIAAAQEAPQ